MSGLISPAARAARKVAAAALESRDSAYGVIDAIVFGLDAAQLFQSPETAAELARLRGLSYTVPHVWQVWEEDGPLYGVYASQADAEGGTIDCYRDMGESCPDHSWKWDIAGTGELLAGDEPVGIFLGRHKVLGQPDPANEVDRLRGENAGHVAHAASLLNQLRAAETAAALVSEYRVPCDEVGSIWLWVRREPGGDRWAILTSHRVEGERRAWVGGRWQALPVVGESGLFEFDTAEDALCQALVLAEGGERP